MKKQKIFWQPELSQMIIFWSVALGIIFYGLILALENTAPYLTSNLVMGLGIILFFSGFHRYMIIDENKLIIYYARIWKRQIIALPSITNCQINQRNVVLKGDFGSFECQISTKNQKKLLKQINIEKLRANVN